MGEAMPLPRLSSATALFLCTPVPIPPQNLIWGFRIAGENAAVSSDLQEKIQKFHHGRDAWRSVRSATSGADFLLNLRRWHTQCWLAYSLQLLPPCRCEQTPVSLESVDCATVG